MTAPLPCVALLVALCLPAPAMAQNGADSRLSELQRRMFALSAQLDQIKAQNQQLQVDMDKMQTNVGQRIERLENGRLVSKPSTR
jgi:septal ring factor EnvC (AmiA/AmiB activator)